ncbi:MAG: GDP-mannose 4,6-dehydratase [Phycisphaeraceae bacterium]|nr:GDP-mannose 4,6-dehydratase [Phycisphaeraceae bacterium]
MPQQSRNILVTGAAGFIGSHTCEALLRRGDRVVGVDNFDPFYAESIKRSNLDAVKAIDGEGRFAFEQADIRQRREMDDVFTKHRPDAVIHLAARAGVRPSIEDPAGYARVNVEGTANILEASRVVGVERLVVASSSSVYGNASKAPFSEDDDISKPISPYAATKCATEDLCHVHHVLYHTPVACLRFFTVFGPRQRPDLAIAKFMRLIDAGQAIPMFGNGGTSRDYTFIGDIVAGVLASLDRIHEHGFRVWNLGGSSPVTLDEMIAGVAATVGKDPLIDHQPSQMGDVERTFADLTRSGAELGYRPRTPFAEGLRAQWAWFEQRQASMRGA